MNVNFYVSGLPMPQGSKTVLRTPQGRTNVVQAGTRDSRQRHEAWREAVRFAAVSAFRGKGPLEGPVVVEVHFCFTRPKSSKREHPSVKPDLDKLVRSVLDSLTGPAYVDDSQVVCIVATKTYEEKAGCSIHVYALPEYEASAPEGPSIDTTGRPAHAVEATTP